MNCKTFTIRILAASMVLGLAISPSFAQNQLHRASAELLEAGMTPATTQGRQLKPVAPTHQTIIRAGKVERINKAAGDTLFYQDFSAATWPADMPRVNRDGKTPNNTTLFGTNAWVAGNITSASAPGLTEPGRYAISTSWYNPAGQSDDWMITPPITVTANNKLSWRSRAAEVDYQDGYEVRVCTNCPATFDNNNVLTSFADILFSVDADQPVVLMPHEVALGAYEGQTVRFAFRNNSNDQNMLYVDDILVSRQPGLDVAAGRIFSPSNKFYNCSRASFPAVVSLSNNGAGTAYNIEVKIKSVGPISDSIAVNIDSLAKGMTDTITLPGGLNMSVVGNYNLILTASLTGDEIPGNNISLSSYLHRGPQDAPYFTNFDGLNSDSTMPQEWFNTSRFLPFNDMAGFSGSTSIEAPVFNNLGANGSQPTCQISTSKFKNITAGSFLSFKYKLTDLQGVEYSMIAGDTVFVNILKNCEMLGSAYAITATNHEPSTSYRKILSALDPFTLVATDEISVEFLVKSAPTTSVFMFELDDFNIGAAVQNDVAMIDLEKYPFSMIKRRQFTPIKIKGSVFNEGSNDLSPVRIVANVSPLGLQDTARINNLPAGTARAFSTNPGISFTSDGSYLIDVNASSPGVTDTNPMDNNLNFTVEATDSVIAKDFGDPLETAYLQYGAGSTGNRIMANAISTVLKDTMTSVSVYVGPLAETCMAKAFFASKNAQGAWSSDSSAVAVTITPDEANSWIPLRFWKNTAAGNKGRAVAANTENLYGVKLRTGNLRVGFNFENATDNGSFIYLGGNFLGTQDITLGTLRGPFSLFVRANFGRTSTILTTISQVEHSLMNADIIPNPAQESAKLVYSTRDGGEVTIQVYSLNGQLINSNTQMTFQGTNRLDIPMRGLSKGMYLVRLNSAGFSSTKKLIVE